jgi:hypothetical protein
VHFIFGVSYGIKGEKTQDTQRGHTRVRRTEKQIKEEIMSDIEAEIDALMEWRREAQGPSLTEIEDRVIELRKAISQRITKMLVESEEATYPSDLYCPKCGKRSENKGLKAIQVRSKVGDVEVERTYWYCRTCREGFFPPG